jgi:hypothetical protein
MRLENATEPKQMDNAVKSVFFKNDGTTLVQKNNGGSDFKDILAPKLEEKAKSTLDSLCARINEFLDNKDSDKLKRGVAAKMVEALLKGIKDKQSAAGEGLSAKEKINLLSLLKRLEEFIKKGLKHGSPGEKDHFSRLKELRQEIFSLITANGSADGSAQAAALAVEKSEEITISLPSAGDDGQRKEKPVRFTLVDLRRNKTAKKSAAIDPASYTGQKKAGAGHELVLESSRQSTPAELKAENNQILVRSFSIESGESKGGVEGSSTLSGAFRRLFIPEIVRQSGIILKDGGKGEIRLILKPESLGRVRIRINIQDNSIEGKILVENNTVRELFEGNLEHLRNALRSGGFDTAALEVAVGGEKSGRDPAKEEFPSMSKEGALDEFERSMVLLADFGEEDLLIDLVV